MTTQIIDVHAHCVPSSFYERITAGDRTLGITSQDTAGGPRWTFDGSFTTAPIEPLLVDLGARVKTMDETGVALQLLSGFIDLGAHHANAAYAQVFNDELAATIAEYPTRFLGLGTLPLGDVDGAVAELRRQINELGFVGVELAAANVIDPALEPIWAEAARLGAIVLFHPESSTTSKLPYFIGNFVANPAETTVAAESLILSGVLERNPDLNVILVHGGGFLPYQFARLNHGFGQYGGTFGATTTVSPREQLRRFYFDTILHDPAVLAYLVETVGWDRVVVGTDYPFLMGDTNPAATVESLTHLDEKQREAIRRTNVVGLLEQVGNAAWRQLAGG